MKEFQLDKYIHVDKLNDNLEKTHDNLTILKKDLLDFSKKGDINLFGGVTEAKANEKTLKELIKLAEKKKKIDAEIIKLEKIKAALEKQNEKARKKSVNTTKEQAAQTKILNSIVNDNLTKEQKLAAQIELSKSKRAQYIKEQGRGSKAVAEETEKIKKLNKKLKEETKVRELNAEIADENAGKLKKLRAEKKLLEMQTEKLTDAELEESGAAKAMVDRLAAVNKELIDFGKKTNDGRANVGRYAESLNEVVENLGSLDFSLNTAKAVLSSVNKLFAKNTEAQEENAKSQSKLKRGLRGVGKGFAAIASIGITTVLSSIAVYFTKSADGAESLEIGMAKLKAAIKPIIGYIIDFGRVAISSFKTIGIQFQLFFKELKLNIAEIKNGLPDMFNVKKSDTSKLEKEINDLKKNLKETKGGVSDVDLSFETLIDKIKEAAKTGEDIAKLSIELRKIRNETEVYIAELEKQLELSRDIGEDDTLNFERRKEAQKAAIKANKELSKQTLDLAQKEVEIAEKQLSLQRKNGLVEIEQAQAVRDAKLSLIAAETQYLTTLRDNGEYRNKLLSDEFELDRDVATDKFESRKAINEKIIASDKYTFDFRKKTLEETKEAGNAVWKEQEKIINNFKNASIKNDNIVLESSIKILESKKKLSDTEKEILASQQKSLAENNKMLTERIDLQELLNAKSEGELAVMIQNAGIGEKFQQIILQLVRDRETAVYDLIEAEQGLNDAEIASAENAYKVNLLVLDLMKEEKDLTGEQLITDKEYYTQKLTFEKQLLTAQLDRLKAQKEGDINIADKEEIAVILKRLKEINGELGKSTEKATEFGGGMETAFGKLLGKMDITKEAQKKLADQMVESFKATAETIAEVFEQIAAKDKDRLEKELEGLETLRSKKEEVLANETELAKQGLANNKAAAASELENTKRLEEEKRKEINETSKAEKAAAVIRIAAKEAETLAELTLAAAKLMSANAPIPLVGVVIGIAAIASMVGAMFALKSQLKGFHDGTEYVDAPEGRDKGIAKVEKGERILTAKQNDMIPRNVKNKDVPKLIQIALRGDNLSPVNNISLKSGNDNEGIEKGLQALLKQQQNREEIINTPKGLRRIYYKNGKINKIVNVL